MSLVSRRKQRSAASSRRPNVEFQLNKNLSLFLFFLFLFFLFFCLFALARRDGTPGGENHPEVPVHRLRRQQAADGEQEAPRRAEEGRPVLQHGGPAALRSPELHLLPGPSGRHFQASWDSSACRIGKKKEGKILFSILRADIFADGKERTWPRRRWPTSSPWPTASWRQMSTELKWKVE